MGAAALHLDIGNRNSKCTIQLKGSVMLQWLSNYPQIIVPIGTAVVGWLSAILASYVKFSQDLSFIKGQLQSILDLHVTIKELQSKHAMMEKDSIQIIRDVEKNNTRISVLEARFAKKEGKLL